MSGRVRFDRNELSGAFGDIGTDFPLIAGMILAADLDPASVLTTFGAVQVLTGLVYGLPMPAQPLKAVAVIAISQRLPAEVIFGGGLVIGLLMLLLTATGLLDWVARVVPKVAIRGIQFGLGLQLGLLALRDYVTADGAPGFALAAVACVLAYLLLGNRRYPPALFIIGLGVAYALATGVGDTPLWRGVGLDLPEPAWPGRDALLTGLLVLALPQLPLSLGNSILATRQIVLDLYPDRAISARKIGLTYALMNLTGPLFGGVPTCHGSGGVVGHYAFGGRTGGSAVIYGSFYLVLGLLFAGSFGAVVDLFPLPVLGVILLFEATALLQLVRDVAGEPRDFALAVAVGLVAVGLPYGYLIGLVLGTILAGHRARRLLTGPDAAESGHPIP